MRSLEEEVLACLGYLRMIELELRLKHLTLFLIVGWGANAWLHGHGRSKHRLPLDSRKCVRWRRLDGKPQGSSEV